MGLKIGINYGNVNTQNVPPDGSKYEPLFSPSGGIFCSYKVNNWYYGTDIMISKRGSLVSQTFPYKGPAYFGFYEWQLSVSRSISNSKFEIGLGFVNAFKAFYSIHLIGEKRYEIDIKAIAKWNINKYFTLESSYLFGGINNAIEKSEAYLFSVCNISFCYSFININKKSP